jgi:hypothetical protein
VTGALSSSSSSSSSPSGSEEKDGDGEKPVAKLGIPTVPYTYVDSTPELLEG